LAALEAEFNANLQQVNVVIEMHDSGVEFVRMLAQLPEESINSLDQETVSRIMLATANPTTFDPVLGTTNALIRAGKLGVLRDSRLR
jgi:hypothetical protein